MKKIIKIDINENDEDYVMMDYAQEGGTCVFYWWYYFMKFINEIINEKKNIKPLVNNFFLSNKRILNWKKTMTKDQNNEYFLNHKIKLYVN